MKKLITFVLAMVCMFGLVGCGTNAEINPEYENNELSSGRGFYSVTFEGTMLFYKDRPYDVTLQNRAINSISSAIPAGEKLVVECHVGPQNSVYCIFDTVSRSFDGHITGNNLVWYDDNVETSVYAFGTEIYTYDGRLIKSYEFEENEYIYQMEFSDDHTKLNVEIMYIDGATQIDIIDL